MIDNKIVIELKDEEDVQYFIQSWRKAVESEGTMPPLYCGILSSVLKRALLFDDDGYPITPNPPTWLPRGK